MRGGGERGMRGGGERDKRGDERRGREEGEERDKRGDEREEGERGVTGGGREGQEEGERGGGESWTADGATDECGSELKLDLWGAELIQWFAQTLVDEPSEISLLPPAALP